MKPGVAEAGPVVTAPARPLEATPAPPADEDDDDDAMWSMCVADDALAGIAAPAESASLDVSVASSDDADVAAATPIDGEGDCEGEYEVMLWRAPDETPTFSGDCGADWLDSGEWCDDTSSPEATEDAAAADAGSDVDDTLCDDDDAAFEFNSLLADIDAGLGAMAGFGGTPAHPK